MKILDVLIMIVLFIILIFGAYLLWLNFPTSSIEFEQYKANISEEFPEKSSQFYTNMRYPTDNIGYTFASRCGERKREDVKKAVERLETETILKFHEASSNTQILITCSQDAPEPEQEGHFVAGEGGPTLIINASRYSVILGGKVSLFRADKCDKPQIATHEILHALGFDHNSNEKSIMYPITNCDQEIDQHIVEEIRRLYSQKAAGDLLIESVDAEKSGPYLGFEITIANFGLKEISQSSLKLFAEDSEIREFEVGTLDIGSKKTLTIKNLRVPRDTERIKFSIVTPEEEISKNNNEASLRIVESD